MRFFFGGIKKSIILQPVKTFRLSYNRLMKSFLVVDEQAFLKCKALSFYVLPYI